jgi:tetratricopeptide (TPR) repeat protein
MMFSRFFRGIILSLLLTTAPSPARAASDEAIEPLLAESWSRAAAALLADEIQQSDPVNRLLIAYVALASNHTNEAMAMFASVQDPDSLHQWYEWTSRLVRANPDNRVAALLLIDAHARLGEVAAGTRAMDDLLRKQPQFALAYDLAGALAILRDDAASAREAFNAASKLDPQLADAWISRGSLEAIARTPLDVPQLGNVRSADVLGNFDRALTLDPTSAPARLGRGVILYGLGQFSEAAEAFADAERVAPWLGLAVYNGIQSKLAALRRYVLQLHSDIEGRLGTTVQAQIDQTNKLLNGRAQESNDRLTDLISQDGALAAHFDPKILDTANESQLRALVKTYGVLAIETANAVRLDANSADLFRRNVEIQKSLGTLNALKNLWEATYNLSSAQALARLTKDVKDALKIPEVGPEVAFGLGMLRITGMAAGNMYRDDQWVGKIGVSRLSMAVRDATMAAAQGTDPAIAIRNAVRTPLGLGEVASLLKAAFRNQYEILLRQESDASVVYGWAHNNLANRQSLSSMGLTPSRPGTSSPTAVLAPANYAADARSHAAFLNTVSQSARGGTVVLVPKDRTQGLLIQQELNRQGVATRVADTPQSAVNLAKQSGATWIIGADGYATAPPNMRPSKLVLKPPDILPGWGGGGPPPPPVGRAGGGRPPPPPPAASSSGATNWIGFQRYSTAPALPSGPGGVRTFKDAMVDDGRWPVHVPLTLCLPAVLVTMGAGLEAR